MKQALIFIITLFFIQCRIAKVTDGDKPVTAEITKEGFIDCFENGLSMNGTPVLCEASAILFDGSKLFVASDKEMPDDRSSVFYWSFKDGFADTSIPAHYLINPFLKKGIKYEDFALTPDGRYALLSTGFDRVKEGSNEWDGYNSILFWKVGEENNAQVISMNGTDSTSVSYRTPISKTLASDSFKNGMPYFKIEGLAATNDKIFLGVREEGKSFDDFTYKAKVLTVSYTVRNNRIALGNDFAVLADMDPNSLQPSIPHKLGLSSIEYDRYNKRFLILTSYEEGENLGAYLWTASLSDLQHNKMNLVKHNDGSSLAFNHKAEDLAIINSHRIIVIDDDDRVMTFVGNQKRAENQAAYSVVEFK
jgi:hypothetical protein